MKILFINNGMYNNNDCSSWFVVTQITAWECQDAVTDSLLLPLWFFLDSIVWSSVIMRLHCGKQG
jgi:hypothetical protein